MALTMTDKTVVTNGNLALLSLDNNFAPPVRSVKANETYEFFGSYSRLVDRDLSNAAGFIASNSKDQESIKEVVDQALSSFLRQAHDDCQLQKDACWFTIRMTTGDLDTKVPRWHKDGRFFDLDNYSDVGSGNSSETSTASSQFHSKYATTLLGPTTPFLNLPLDHAELASRPVLGANGPYTDYLLGGEDLPTREKIAEFFNDHDIPIVRGKLGQIARFAYGSEHGVVHSEPDMSDCDRVFVSVLFGSLQQLRGLCERWGREWRD